jgi:hypothetical protein
VLDVLRETTRQAPPNWPRIHQLQHAYEGML